MKREQITMYALLINGGVQAWFPSNWAVNTVYNLGRKLAFPGDVLEVVPVYCASAFEYGDTIPPTIPALARVS